ncbi:MAG: hypothetical protein NE330_02165 [Lentisphaeraceae bacterium]|nr:hypothetical protein [Lentisphaeraceae bacterium]
MKLVGVFIFILAMLNNMAYAQNKNIADKAIVVVKIKSFDDLKAFVPAMAQQQLMMAEASLPFIDKGQEIIVALTSVIPPVAYAAVPVSEGTTLESVKPMLPPNLQATATLKGQTLLLPISGALPAKLGQSKIVMDKDSVIHVNVDVETLNKVSGPQISALMQLGMANLAGTQQDPKQAELMNAVLKLYQYYIMDLMKSSKSLEIMASKERDYKIDVISDFIAGTNWAKLCEAHSSYSLPTVKSMNDASMQFSTIVDYGTFEPILAPMDIYMKDLGKYFGGDLKFQEMMDLFVKLGETKMFGGMSMSKEEFDINYLIEAEKGQSMSAVMEAWKNLMPENASGISIKETEKKLNGEKIYKYDPSELMKTAEMPAMESYISTKGNSMYYSSSIEGLESLSKKMLEDSNKKGFMWMKMDMAKIAGDLPLTPGFQMPIVELLSESGKTTMTTTLWIK